MSQFKRFVAACVLLSSLLLAFAPFALARDLEGRLGLGYNAQFANDRAPNGVPGISLKYAFTKEMAIEGIIGMATDKPTNSVVGAKIFRNIFYEQNLNFYMMGALGVVSASGQSGTDFQGGFGTEFFIPGLESIGFSMEVGGEFTNLSGSFEFRTLGLSFLNAGMRFYF